MAFSSVAAFVDVLRQVPLLEPEQMAELARLAAGSADARGLAGELVRRGWLTPYQVNQLFQGRGQQLVLGSFILLERLGEGGMGQVFKGRHRKLGRIDALKVIRKERLVNPDAVRRFRREIQAAAQLSHPNIVRALDADEYEGTHFFAMEYVEGDDLAKYIKQKGPLPVETACEFIRQAAAGLQHAHERGMVHRDIKPHNLLLVTRTNTVKVLDMGLARLRSEVSGEMSSTSLTEEGAVMGTPDYIAPEQAMDSRSADIRADLYSLGCTFYYLLAGRVPFAGGTIMEKLFRHQTERPRSLLEFRPDVPPPVAAVVHRLLAKRPAERFQTPAELLTALAAARAPGAAVAAVPVASAADAGMPSGTVTFPNTLPRDMPPPPPSSQRTPDTAPFADLREDTVRMDGNTRPIERATERKHLLLMCAGGGAVLALVLLLIVFFRNGPNKQPSDNPPPRGMESSSSEAADKEWKTLRTRGESSGVDRVKFREDILTFRRTHPGTRPAIEAAEWLMRLPSPLDRWTVQPLSPWQKLAGQPKELLAVLGDHRSWVGFGAEVNRVYVQYSPDGRWLACNAGDGTIRLFNPDHLIVKAVLKAEELQGALDFRRDSKVLATCGRSSVVLWDVSGEQPQQIRVVKGFPAGIGAAALSPDGKRLAVPCWTEPPTVRLWDIAGEPKELAVLKGHASGTICKPAFSPDGKTLATGSKDKTVRIWDLSGNQPKERAVLKNHTYWVVSVTFSPDGKLLASSGQHDYTVRLWDMTADEPKELTGPWLGNATNDVVFSPDGKRLACGFWQGQWRLWDVSERQLKQIAQVPDHATMVWGVSFAPDGRTLATASRDGTVHLWHVHEMPPRQCFVSPGHGQPITGLVFTPDDGTLVSMSRDGTVRLWDLKVPPERERAVLAVQRGYVYGAVHPDGRTLVTGDDSEKRVFWDIASGKELRSAPGQIWNVAYRPDGKMLVAAEEGFTVKFWDVETGELKRTERLEQGVPLRAVAISPDGRRVAVSTTRGIVHLWQTRNQQDHRTCTTPEGCAETLAFSPDGKTLAAAGNDKRVRLFDAANGRERSSLPGHDSAVSFVAFTPDGKQLISAGADGKVIVRDSGDGRELKTLNVPLPITVAALAGDGRHLAVGHIDGTIYLLRLAEPPRTRP